MTGKGQAVDTRQDTAADEQWAAKVGHALRNLDDRSELNCSPLARPAYVEKVAKDAQAQITTKDVGA